MDQFEHHAPGLENLASRLFENRSERRPLGLVTRAIAVETASHVQVVTASGDTGCIFVAAGFLFPLQVAQVMATGTTAPRFSVGEPGGFR